MLPAAGMACSFAVPDALLLKQVMAKEIAFRLALRIEQVPLDGITAPQLQRPFGPDAECASPQSLHYSAGFRITVAALQLQQQHAFATMGKPHTASGAGARARSRYQSGFYTRWPGAGVRPNFWRAPRFRFQPVPESVGYERWPQYPTERELAASAPGPAADPQRWPQYPREADFSGPAPTQPARWSTMQVAPATLQGQGVCRYEGMAVVLGPDAESPVAVNFTRQCD